MTQAIITGIIALVIGLAVGFPLGIRYKERI